MEKVPRTRELFHQRGCQGEWRALIALWLEEGGEEGGKERDADISSFPMQGAFHSLSCSISLSLCVSLVFPARGVINGGGN